MSNLSYAISELSYAEDSGLLALAISGTLDTGNAAAFRTEANTLTMGKSELKTVKLYIEGLSYVSSMGIGSMVDWMIELRKKRIALYFVNTPPQIKSVMDLLGFTNFLNLCTEKRDPI